jgi:hypothetical protein
MALLQCVRAVPAGDGAGRWFRHVVRPLLCPPVQVRMAMADAGALAAPAAPAPPWRTRAGGAFTGREGAGCALSPAEQAIAARLAADAAQETEAPPWN